MAECLWGQVDVVGEEQEMRRVQRIPGSERLASTTLPGEQMGCMVRDVDLVIWDISISLRSSSQSCQVDPSRRRKLQLENETPTSKYE